MSSVNPPNLISMVQFKADREFVNNINRTLGKDLPEAINLRFAALMQPEDIPHGFDWLNDDHAYLRRSLIQFIHSIKCMLIGGCKDKMFRGSLPFAVELEIQSTPVEQGARTSRWAIHLPTPFASLDPLITCTARWLPAGTEPGDYSGYGEPLEFQGVLNAVWADHVTLPENPSPEETKQIIRSADRLLADGLFLGAIRDAVICLLSTAGGPMEMQAEHQDDDFAMNPLGARYIKGDKVFAACETRYRTHDDANGDGGRVILDFTYNVNVVRQFIEHTANLFGS